MVLGRFVFSVGEILFEGLRFEIKALLWSKTVSSYTLGVKKAVLKEIPKAQLLNPLVFM